MIEVKLKKESIFKNLEVAINTIKGKVAKVGWFENAKYDDKNSTPVATVAAIQEWGSPSKKIPARPFLRPTITEKNNEWNKIALQQSKLIIQGNQTAQGLMEILGQKAQADITKKIKSIWSPSLSRSTIQARINKYSNDTHLKESTRKRRKKEIQKFVSSGFYKPLIHTGHMISTLINVVEDE